MAALDDSYFYKHSGRHGLAVPAIMLIVLPVAVLLAAVYSYIVVYCPVVGYVNILFLGGFLIGIGAVFRVVAKKSKCRSPGLLGFLGLLTGVVALYFSWVFFLHALLNRAEEPVPVMALASSPSVVWELAKEINKTGWWGPSGIFQWAIVSIEAAIIVLGPAFFGLSCLDRDVFCEECRSWCEPEEEKHLQTPADFAKPSAENVNHLEILKLPEADDTDYPRFTAEVLKCTGCGDTTAIRLKLVQMTVDDGEEKESSEDIPGILLQKANT